MLRSVAAVLCVVSAVQATAQNSGVVHVSQTVDVTLASGVLDYTISDVLRNTGALNAEVDYTLPLPALGAFHSLSMSINGEMIGGEMMSALRARTIYNAIRRTTRDPALVEWLRHGQLRTRIFPIFPGEVKYVETRMQAVAQRQGGAIRLDFLAGSRRGTAAERRGPPITLTLHYPDSAHYGVPYSTTHDVWMRGVSGTSRTFTVTGSSDSVTVFLPLMDSGGAAISVLTHAPAGDAGFALITFRPPSLRIAERRRDLVVVVDASMSMTGERLETAKTVARRILSQLKRGDRFRVVAFADSVRASQTAFSDATDRNIRRAERFIAGLVADGNSNMSAALEHALGSFAAVGAEDRAENVILLTDGAPTAGEVNAPLILTRVKEIAGRARIIVFGIGAGTDAGLLTTLARETGGSSYISAEYRTFAQRAEALIRNASNPMIADFSIAAEGVVLESFQPASPRDVFAGQTIQLLARYRGAGRSVITISGRGADGPVRWSDTVEFPALWPANDALARIWATDRVGDLSSYRPGSCGGGIHATEIGELGERYSVPTEYNSYLVLEPGVQVDARGNVLNAEQFRNGGGASGRGGGDGAGARGGAAAPGAVAARRLGPVIQPAAGDAVIQIRNPLSITGYTAPMIIVDGVIQMQDDPTLGGAAGNPLLPGLEPEEIRSIEVIRGAAAAALYGQRAANGVINITTVRAVGRETGQTLSRFCAADPWSEPLLSMTLSTWQREAMARQVAELQRFLTGWRVTAAPERTLLEVDPVLRRLLGEILANGR